MPAFVSLCSCLGIMWPASSSCREGLEKTVGSQPWHQLGFEKQIYWHGWLERTKLYNWLCIKLVAHCIRCPGGQIDVAAKIEEWSMTAINFLTLKTYLLI